MRSVLSVGCRKGVAVLAVITVGRRKHHLLGVEAVSRHVGLELCPDARVGGVRAVVIDSSAELAHGHNPSGGIRHDGFARSFSDRGH